MASPGVSATARSLLLLGMGFVGLIVVPSIFGLNAPRSLWPFLWLSIIMGLGLTGAAIGAAIGAAVPNRKRLPGEPAKHEADRGPAPASQALTHRTESTRYAIGCSTLTILMAIAAFLYLLFTGGFC